MKSVLEHLDPGSIVILAITLLLFAVSLFVKGLTHDMLLEAGVFLVSVKLIRMSYENSQAARTIERELAEIKRS